MSSASFEKFRQLVVEKEELFGQLMGLPDIDTFIARTVELGQQHGFVFTDEDVREAFRERRREWVESEFP